MSALVVYGSMAIGYVYAIIAAGKFECGVAGFTTTILKHFRCSASRLMKFPASAFRCLLTALLIKFI